jgi:acyl-CoA thioesterase-1
MRTLFLVLSLVLYSLTGGIAPAWAANKPVILILGDSLSAGYGIPPDQGWVARLQQRLDGEGYGYTVVNASVSGETTAGALERLPRALTLHRPAIVVIELGGNDGLRGLPVNDLRLNLEAIVTTCQDAGSEVVLTGIRIPPNYGPQYTETFYGVYETIARQQEIPWVPFLLEGIALRDDLFQDDGIHPDLQAQPLLLDHVWRILEPMLKH